MIDDVYHMSQSSIRQVNQLDTGLGNCHTVTVSMLDIVDASSRLKGKAKQCLM